jgi:tRNA A22 N-methylase
MQPMTSAEDLRQYLCANGFCILKERAVKSQGRIYTVIKAVFDGQRRECSPLFYHLGLLTENPTADEIEYILRKQRIIQKLADDIKDIATERERRLKLQSVLDSIEELLEK